MVRTLLHAVMESVMNSEGKYNEFKIGEIWTLTFKFLNMPNVIKYIWWLYYLRGLPDLNVPLNVVLTSIKLTGLGLTLYFLLVKPRFHLDLHLQVIDFLLKLYLPQVFEGRPTRRLGSVVHCTFFQVEQLLFVVKRCST